MCHVSAVSRGFFPVDCFPQLGPRSLSSRNSEAVTSRSRSSSTPILMGWWSVQRSDYTKIVDVLAERAEGLRLRERLSPWGLPLTALARHIITGVTLIAPPDQLKVDQYAEACSGLRGEKGSTC